jgi:hypothetical protein
MGTGGVGDCNAVGMAKCTCLVGVGESTTSEARWWASGGWRRLCCTRHQWLWLGGGGWSGNVEFGSGAGVAASTLRSGLSVGGGIGNVNGNPRVKTSAETEFRQRQDFRGTGSTRLSLVGAHCFGKDVDYVLCVATP